MEALSGWIQFLYSSLFRNTRKLLLYLKINLLSIQKLQVQLQVQDFVSSSDVLRCLTELLSFGLLNFPNIIWTLKNNKKEFNVNWQILKRAISYRAFFNYITGGPKPPPPSPHGGPPTQPFWPPQSKSLFSKI
jgi:hypothetical protein